MVLYYFLPGVTLEQLVKGGQLDRGLLHAWGLADVLADVAKVPEHASALYVRDNKGPGSQCGTVIAPVSKHRGPPPVFYDPARQHWVQGGEPGPDNRLWIGTLNGHLPTPVDLERWTTLGGLEIDTPLGKLRVPIARAPSGGELPLSTYGTLPKAYTFNTAGEPLEHLDPAWRWLWELAGEVRDWFISQADPPAEATPEERARHTPRPFSWLVQQAAKVLGVNYRLGPAELTLLHGLGKSVLTEDAVWAICRTLYGWEVLEEAKKKQPAEEGYQAPS